MKFLGLARAPQSPGTSPQGNFVAARMRGIAGLAAIFLLCVPALGRAQITGTVDSSNIGIATEDAIISSGLPDMNLDFRTFNNTLTAQQLLNTNGPDYPTPEAAGASQEYMIFKFDLSTLPAGATATAPGSFDFSAWFTLEENTPTEVLFGAFRFFEITAGSATWQDRFADSADPPTENPTPVTFNSLSGSFVELTGVTEDNTDPPNNQTGNPFGVLYPGQLVSNGGFDGANRIVGIPIETINRLISGQSVGLAIGSIPPTPASPPGDYNTDGQVDGDDFLDWQSTLGATVAAGEGADGDNSGTIDAGDLQIWSENYGETGTAPGAGTTNFSIHTSESFFNPASAPTLNFDWSAPAGGSVPEPGALALAIASFGMFVTQFRRASRRRDAPSLIV